MSEVRTLRSVHTVGNPAGRMQTGRAAPPDQSPALAPLTGPCRDGSVPPEAAARTARKGFAMTISRLVSALILLPMLAVADAQTAITALSLEPREATPGDPVVLSVTASEAVTGLECRQPYYVAPQNVPPGFTYVPAEKSSRLADPGHESIVDNGFLDADPAPNAFRIPLDTTGWNPGLYFFEIQLAGRPVCATRRSRYAVPATRSTSLCPSPGSCARAPMRNG